VAGCYSFEYIGTESNRSGVLHYGTGISGSQIASMTTQAATLNQWALSLPYSERCPTSKVEVLWKPGRGKDQSFSPIAGDYLSGDLTQVDFQTVFNDCLFTVMVMAGSTSATGATGRIFGLNVIEAQIVQSLGGVLNSGGHSRSQNTLDQVWNTIKESDLIHSIMQSAMSSLGNSMQGMMLGAVANSGLLRGGTTAPIRGSRIGF